jgi:hypothetical protein
MCVTMRRRRRRSKNIVVARAQKRDLSDVVDA